MFAHPKVKRTSDFVIPTTRYVPGGYTLRYMETAAVTYTSGGSNHTKGSWQQITSDVGPRDIRKMEVEADLLGSNGIVTGCLVDYAIGKADGGLRIILPNFAMSYAVSRQAVIPLYVPAGAGLWARVQTQVASDTITLLHRLYSGGENSPPGLWFDALGVDTSNSKGVAVTPGSAAWSTSVAIKNPLEREYVWLGSTEGMNQLGGGGGFSPSTELQRLLLAGHPYEVVGVTVEGRETELADRGLLVNYALQFGTSNEEIKTMTPHIGSWLERPIGPGNALAASLNGISGTAGWDVCGYGGYVPGEIPNL